MSAPASTQDAPKRYQRGNPQLKSNLILDAIITLALTLVMLFVFNSFQSPHRNLLKSSGALALSASELVAEVKAERVAAYWLGPISGSKYSLVITSSGDAIISYLSGGEGLSNPKQRNLVIQTRAVGQNEGALVATDTEFTNRNDMTSAGNTFSFDTTSMNFMSVEVKDHGRHVMLYYPSTRTFQTMETDAESLVRIN